MRTFIPLVAVFIGLLLVLAFLRRGDEKPPWQADDVPSEQTEPTGRTAPHEDGAAPTFTESQTQVSRDVSEVSESVDRSAVDERSLTLSAGQDEAEPVGRFAIQPATGAQIISLGSNLSDTLYKLKVDLTYFGPGIKRISLSDYNARTGVDEPYVIHQVAEAGNRIIYPFQARAVTINNQRVMLDIAEWNLVDQQADNVISSATYQLNIVDDDDAVVLEIERKFQLASDSYDLHVNQAFVNRSGRPLEVVWEQYAQADATDDGVGYRGDERYFIAGYFNLEQDPERRFIYDDETYLIRQNVLGKWDPELENSFWPVDKLAGHSELVWLACLNRYFAVALHSIPRHLDDGEGPLLVPALEASFDRFGMKLLGDEGSSRRYDARKTVFTLTSKPFRLNAGEMKRLDLGLYAGPRDSTLFKDEPYQSLWFKWMVKYQLGTCALCTFQPLAKLLLAILKGVHYVVRDWGVSIILLVLFVRTLLHPITKKGQVNMMKMGKQMQALAPEIEKIKKKYENDQKKIGAETMKLYRERGVNLFNMVGCLPMVLQMPIWVALYAMLYLAIELRHEPAFYGLFQSISGGAWSFLRDLSAPDRFIQFFDTPKQFNLLFIYFDYSSINILPLLMAVVFFLQQKLTMTPAATEEQRRQQKMMGYMVFIFPVFMYSMPSGLTLYIMSSTAIGIVESYRVRKHIREQEEAGILFERKPRKPGGLLDRVQKAVQAKQRQMQSKMGGSDADSDRRGATYKQRKRR